MPEKEEKEKGGIGTLLEWAKTVRSLFQNRIKMLKTPMSTKATSVFKDHDAAETLSIIHNRYVVVPADKPLTTSYLSAKSIK